MNRLHPRTAMRRLPPRATVIGGAALGLLAGAAVYGGVSSSASDQKPAAFVPPKAPVAAAPVSYARCAAGSKLEKNVCVVRVVKTVTAPAPAAPAATAAAAAAKGSIPASTVKPSAAKAVVRAAAVAPARRATPVATPTTTPPGEDDERTGAPTPTASASPTTTPAPSAAS
ncbi:MAG TPA: hypothetical protein VF391_07440 [Dermatophilaceae bacterium]